MHFPLLCLSWLTLPLTVFGLKGDWACKSALCVASVVENNVVHCKLHKRWAVLRPSRISKPSSLLEIILTLDTHRRIVHIARNPRLGRNVSPHVNVRCICCL